jgi:hypothetical protein
LTFAGVESRRTKMSAGNKKEETPKANLEGQGKSLSEPDLKEVQLNEDELSRTSGGIGSQGLSGGKATLSD